MNTASLAATMVSRIVAHRGARQAMVSLLTILVLGPLISPTVMAMTDWEEDGWLHTMIAEDRLAAGDEFACYGFPGLSWEANAGDVASACMDYVSERINASKWAANPVSIYMPSGLTYADHESVSNVGFPVHGDLTGMPSTAWYNGSDAPTWEEDWYDLGRRGGSLEAVVSNQAEVEAEAAQGGLLNFYWIGRVDDATVRHDRDLEDWLLDSDAWFTTWGEAWSYWASQRCYSLVKQEGTTSGDGLTFEYERTVHCQSQDLRVWPVPLTWVIDLNGSIVSSVDSEAGELAQINASVNNLAEGWRQEGDLVYLTVSPNRRVELNTDSSVEDYDVTGVSENFNNHSFAVTIAAHETSDLFKWSNRFDADSDLRFTWLLIPRDARSDAGWIPVAGVVVIVATVAMTFHLLAKDKRQQQQSDHGLGLESFDSTESE